MFDSHWMCPTINNPPHSHFHPHCAFLDSRNLAHSSNLKSLPERFRDFILGYPVMHSIQKEAIPQKMLCARMSCMCVCVCV